MDKATFVKAIYDKYDRKRVDLVYDYRGYHYIVSKNMYLTEWENKCSDQHKEEQAKIDAKIANKDKKPVTVKRNSADEAIDMLFRFWNGEEEL